MAQDGIQAAGTVTASSTGAVGFSYASFTPAGTSGSLFPLFHNFQIIASSSNAAGAMIDITGATAIATTSVGYPLAPSERFPGVAIADRGRTGIYSGFSLISASGTATVRFAAW